MKLNQVRLLRNYGKHIKKIILTLLTFHGISSWILFDIYIKLDIRINFKISILFIKIQDITLHIQVVYRLQVRSRRRAEVLRTSCAHYSSIHAISSL